MNALLIVSLFLGFATAASRAEITQLEYLRCVGSLVKQKSSYGEKEYLLDSKYAGIDTIEFKASSDGREYLLADRPAHVTIKSRAEVAEEGGQEQFFPDPSGASSKSSTIKVVRVSKQSESFYSSLWSDPGVSKMSASYFASVSDSNHGFLELLLTSGAPRRYHYELDCKRSK